MKLVSMFMWVVLLTGCASLFRPSEEEAAKADYGLYPNNYKEIVATWIDDNLFDPSSVQGLKIGAPEKGYIGRTFGYRVKVTLNAKNRMGGYVGKKTYYIFIRDGEIVDFWKEGEM